MVLNSDCFCIGRFIIIISFLCSLFPPLRALAIHPADECEFSLFNGSSFFPLSRGLHGKFGEEHFNQHSIVTWHLCRDALGCVSLSLSLSLSLSFLHSLHLSLCVCLNNTHCSSQCSCMEIAQRITINIYSGESFWGKQCGIRHRTALSTPQNSATRCETRILDANSMRGKQNQSEGRREAVEMDF